MVSERIGTPRLGGIAAVTTLVALALCAVAIACSSGAPTLAPTSTLEPDATVIRQLVEREFMQLRERDWRGVYENYSPSFRAACPYAAFEQFELSSISGIDPARMTVSDVRVRVEGDQAYVTYIYEYDGQGVSTIDASAPDVFVKVGERWYDEIDTHVEC